MDLAKKLVHVLQNRPSVAVFLDEFGKVEGLTRLSLTACGICKGAYTQWLSVPAQSLEDIGTLEVYFYSLTIKKYTVQMYNQSVCTVDSSDF
jgi:hypothetical protein